MVVIGSMEVKLWRKQPAGQPAGPVGLAGDASAAATFHPVEHGVWLLEVAALTGQQAESGVFGWGCCTHVLLSPLGLTAAG